MKDERNSCSHMHIQDCSFIERKIIFYLQHIQYQEKNDRKGNARNGRIKYQVFTSAPIYRSQRRTQNAGGLGHENYRTSRQKVSSK